VISPRLRYGSFQGVLMRREIGNPPLTPSTSLMLSTVLAGMLQSRGGGVVVRALNYRYRQIYFPKRK